jgi:hypothetical protein
VSAERGETKAGQDESTGVIEENILRINVAMDNHGGNTLKEIQRATNLNENRIVPRWNSYVRCALCETSAWNWRRRYRDAQHTDKPSLLFCLLHQLREVVLVAIHWNVHRQFDPIRPIWLIISWSSSLHDVRLSSKLESQSATKVSTCLLRLGDDEEWLLHCGFGHGDLVYKMLQIFSPPVVVL